MKVSFDFDGTLSRPDVQEYAKELIESGIEVIVTTSRLDESNKYLYSINPTNEDLYAITDSLGIKRENIYFTNMDDKVNYLHNDIAWHLDDDEYELWEIFNSNLNVEGVDVNDDDWRGMCNFSMEGRE
jgi:hypothetical protein